MFQPLLIATFLLGVAIRALGQNNVTVNSTDSSIQYSGNVGPALLCQYDSSGNIVSGQGGCYNAPSMCTKNVTMGQDPNGAADFKFKGSAIYINSLLYDLSPMYTVTLDGNATDVDGVRSSLPFDCFTLYSQGGLDPGKEHEIKLSIKGLSPNRNQSVPSDNFTQFSLISFVYTTADGSNSTNGTSTSSAPSSSTTSSNDGILSSRPLLTLFSLVILSASLEAVL